MQSSVENVNDDDYQQLCYSTMDDLLSKFSHLQGDVAKIVQQRVPAFVERAIRVMEERDELRLQIENCIGRIFAGIFDQPEYPNHHVLHLGFACLSLSADGLLHGFRRELFDRNRCRPSR